MHRAEILKAALDATVGPREETYGDCRDNMKKIASLWAAYLNHPVNEIDVPNMLAMLKIARSQGGAGTADNFVDGSAYIAIAGQMALQKPPIEIEEIVSVSSELKKYSFPDGRYVQTGFAVHLKGDPTLWTIRDVRGQDVANKSFAELVLINAAENQFVVVRPSELVSGWLPV